MLAHDERQRRTRAIEDALRDGCAPPGFRSRKGPAVSRAAQTLGDVSRQTLDSQIRDGIITPDWSLYQKPDVPIKHVDIPEPPKPDARETIRTAMKNGGTLEDIAAAAQITKGQALDILEGFQREGLNVHEFSGTWSMAKDMVPAYMATDLPVYESRADNTFVFGVTSDNHLCSKYAREDVLNDLYDEFLIAGADRVFNAGNWIDGEARFNKHELSVHGIERQLDYLVENYPRRDGLTTFAVAGDDHEGWYAQREGVDIGKYAERKFRDVGRNDWVNLGYMEAHVRLVNANTGNEAVLAVVHPGGGSAYALSYSIQKIIESLDGGEKPAVGIYGHYHKLWAGNIRNVWCVQTGCTQDQTSFMRKRKLEAHVGGAIVTLRQDPETGAITGCLPDLRRYFNRGYYNNRWGMAGPVTLPERTIA